jgi:hypothetical protein
MVPARQSTQRATVARPLSASDPQPNEAPSHKPEAATAKVAADPEERTQRIKDRLEILLAVLLGLAALATAFAAYQGDLYGGDSVVKLNDSVRATAQASQKVIEGNQAFTQDVELFLEFAKLAQRKEDVGVGQYFRDSLMDENMQKALSWWSDDKDAQTPFEEGSPYVRTEYVEAEKLERQARSDFDLAIDLDNKGDSFMLYTVLYASALFLYGIASVARQLKVRYATMTVGFIIFLLATGMMLNTYFSGPDLVT